MSTIYDLLQQDHDKVKKAFSKILETTDRAEKTRETVFAEIKHDLEVHTRFEEEVFYPRFREAKADKEAKAEVKDALDEHAEAKEMLKKLDRMDKTSDDFIDKLQELQEALEHHISDEEDEMFPQARKTLSPEIAEKMGKEYRQMKSQ
ncbi:MAG: hemerythrin domain-containing protein [Rhodospirillaceae bacterium]